MKKLNDKVKFDFIRYANCWEDADVLLAGLNPVPGKRFLSIASAGDNSLSLLTSLPELVVAVDVSAVQLYLLELKIACFKMLTHDEMLRFLGVKPDEARLVTYLRLRQELTSEAQVFWDTNTELVTKGIIFCGKFERYFSLFRKWILPLIHSSKINHELFSVKPEKQQQQFYHEKWNTWRWRLLFRFFFSQQVMGRVGRDPEFLNEVKVPVAEYIFRKAAVHLQSTNAQSNYFLKFIHLGNFGIELPHYLRAGNFETIKSNINKLVLVRGYAQDALKRYPAFDYFNLSNIFEYMPVNVFKDVAGSLITGAAHNAKFAYWNLMVTRRMALAYPPVMADMGADKFAERDCGFFYNRFIVEEKQ